MKILHFEAVTQVPKLSKSTRICQCCYVPRSWRWVSTGPPACTLPNPALRGRPIVLGIYPGWRWPKSILVSYSCLLQVLTFTTSRMRHLLVNCTWVYLISEFSYQAICCVNQPLRMNNVKGVPLGCHGAAFLVHDPYVWTIIVNAEIQSMT